MKRNILIIIHIFWIAINLDGQNTSTNNNNYIYKAVPTEAMSSVSNLTVENSMHTFQYFDGLGRPQQIVQVGFTPSKQTGSPIKHDVAIYQEYDKFGRESNSWLPVVLDANNNGLPVSLATIVSKSLSTYNDSKSYSIPGYESSPLNRVLEQCGPGESWHSNEKKMKTKYLSNDQSKYKCIWYRADDADRTSTSITINSTNIYYGSNQLFVTQTIDEDDKGEIFVFKDKQGQLVLTRQINGTDTLDTNYVYDAFGNLRVVLPPLASKAIKTAGTHLETATALAQYAYYYKYDSHNRCTGKKLPSAGWSTYIYDKADKLIFSQDAEQAKRPTKQWTFYLYDNFNRLVMQGTCKSVAESNIPNMLVTTSFTPSNTGIESSGYTSNYGATADTVHIINYYDDYRFRKLTGFTGNSNFPDSVASARGLLTANITRVLNSNKKLYAAHYYDKRGNEVKTVSTNHLEGYDKTTTTYSFTQKPLTMKLEHGKTATITHVQEYKYDYDHMDRLITIEHKITGSNNFVTLARYEYDDLGRMKTKKLHGSSSTNNVQNYAYNVRSWTTDITGGRFNQHLFYNTSAANPRWNGNIGSMTWKVATETATRGYKFTCDSLNRLISAVYGETDAISGTNKYGENIAYDWHGNITSFKRYGNTTGTTYGLTDNLSFGYTGNRLKYVNDAVGTVNEAFHFKNGNTSTGDEYLFNLNGNMTKDLNKKISSIEYYSLNLPKQVNFVNGNKTSYLYDGSGIKRQAVHKTGSTTKTTDYCGTVIYENGVVKRILTDEGYITYSGSTPTYYYYLKDHLGNNRVVINSDGTVQQTNHYYPFGGLFAQSTAGVQPYKYNGKEFDTENGLDLYDYEARHMEPALGRFTTMDPHAENYYCWSPYHYAGSNPLRITDPTGMDWYQDETGNYHWKEGSEDIEGFVNIGSSVSLQTGKNSYLNFYQQAGIATNKAVNAFDLISSSTGLQSKLLGNGSPLSEQSKSQLFNALVGKDVDAFARPIGEAVTEFGAGMLIGAAAAKALSWGIGRLSTTFSNFGEKLFLSERFGITSKWFGSSAAEAQGMLNKPRRFFKAGWSTNINAAGEWGYKFRIGIGANSMNSNIARFHMYIPKSYVTNSFANSSIQVKRSLLKLGSQPY